MGQKPVHQRERELNEKQDERDASVPDGLVCVVGDGGCGCVAATESGGIEAEPMPEGRGVVRSVACVGDAIKRWGAFVSRAQLIAFVNSHDGCRVEGDEGETLKVSGEVMFPDRHVERVTERIAATLQSARDCLGY